MKNKIKILTLIFILLLSLTGCNNEDIKLNPKSFNLNFRYFLLPNTQSIQSIKVNSIDLSKESVNLDIIENIDGMIYSMYKKCSNYEFYINNFNNKDVFYEEIKKYINEDVLEKIKEQNDIKQSIDNIFEKENTSFYDTQIVSYNNKYNNKYFEFEIICINNEIEFLIEYIQVYINDENEIIDIKLLGELEKFENTTKPLNKNSLLNEENIHKDFLNIYKEFTNNLKNTTLYEKYNLASNNSILLTDEEQNITQEQIDSKEYLEKMELQVNNLIKNLNSSLDNEILKKFFLCGEGSFKNTFITEFQIEDYNGLATSTYIVSSVSNGELFTFEITFDRIKNEITNIKQK